MGVCGSLRRGGVVVVVGGPWGSFACGVEWVGWWRAPVSGASPLHHRHTHVDHHQGVYPLSSLLSAQSLASELSS